MIILPKAPPQYDVNDQQQARATIEREDANNAKKTIYATTKVRGVVRVDGTTIQAAVDGTISALTRTANSGSSAAPTGNVSTTEKAMGLGLGAGYSITPAQSGNVVVLIGGMALNSTAAGDGTNIKGRYGTGTAPSNAATTGLGTQFGATQEFRASTTAGQQGFIVMGTITGLTLGTAYWFDLSLVAVTGGGASVKDVQIVVFEV